MIDYVIFSLKEKKCDFFIEKKYFEKFENGQF